MTIKKCNRCEANIIWPENYVKNQKPLNLDGSIHNCVKFEPTKTQSIQNTISIREKMEGLGMLVAKLKIQNEKQEKRIKVLEKGNEK